MMRPSSVLIIEPRRLFREGLQQLLGAPLFEVVGAASSLEEAMEVAVGMSPALVIWGTGATDQVESQVSAMRGCGLAGGTRLVVLTDVADVSWLSRVASSGVDAILSPDISTEVLQRSLDLVVLGQQLFPAVLAYAASAHPPDFKPMSNEGANGPARRAAPAVRHHSAEIEFSGREDQILRCLMTGASNKAIARELHISEIAVKAHVKALLRKIRVSNRTQVAIWAHHKRNINIAGKPGEVAPLQAMPDILRQPTSV